jgi:hypothetical protein
MLAADRVCPSGQVPGTRIRLFVSRGKLDSTYSSVACSALSIDIPDPSTLMQTHALAMQRFASTVILPLASIFRVRHRACSSLCPTHSSTARPFLNIGILRLGRSIDRFQQRRGNLPERVSPQLFSYASRIDSLVRRRYYLAWHDQAVMLGETQEAMISWFFSLAHELAHNAVADHNSEHEVCLCAHRRLCADLLLLVLFQ